MSTAKEDHEYCINLYYLFACNTDLYNFFRRATSYEVIDKLDESLADFKKVLELDPSSNEAQAAVIRLPPLIEERNEKLKTEVMGKLKDLGNHFFKGYSIFISVDKLFMDLWIFAGGPGFESLERN